MNQVWRSIVGLEFSSYEVSNHGNICNTNTGKILKNIQSTNGYLQVILYHQKESYFRYVHRLVAEAFVPVDECYIPYDLPLTVNHINGDKFDNYERNLEWLTYAENNRHAVATGLSVYDRERFIALKKRVRIEQTGDVYDSVRECAKAIGASPQYVSNHLKGRLPHCKGYTLSYV